MCIMSRIDVWPKKFPAFFVQSIVISACVKNRVILSSMLYRLCVHICVVIILNTGIFSSRWLPFQVIQ